MKIPSKEEMRARYWEVHNAMDAVRAKTAPLREARDAFVNEAREKDEAMMAEIFALEADTGLKDDKGKPLGMFDAQNELAFWARALSNVGDNPALEGAEAPADA